MLSHQRPHFQFGMLLFVALAKNPKPNQVCDLGLLYGTYECLRQTQLTIIALHGSVTNIQRADAPVHSISNIQRRPFHEMQKNHFEIKPSILKI